MLLRQDMCTKWPRTTAHVTDVVLVSAKIQFNTGRMAAEGVLDRKVELLTCERSGFLSGVVPW